MRHHHHYDLDTGRTHYHHDHGDDNLGDHDHNRSPVFYDDECCNDFFDVGTPFHDFNADHTHAATAVNTRPEFW